MQSTRDQVQAHMFVMGRLTSGMLRGDPDAPESPQGRTNRGIALGIVLAVLFSAGAFVFGLLKPGTKDSWKAAGTLVIEKSTGSRYLYLDGRLRPVRNYTSARLLAGADMKTATVRSASLKGTPHGAPVGIGGAPDALPPSSALDDGPWQVCSGTATGFGAGAPTSYAGTTLAVSVANDGKGLATTQGLLVRGPDRATYLVWRGSKLRLGERDGATEALGYGSVPPVPVSAAFLNSLPSGPDLAPPDVPGRGSKGPRLSGKDTRIGEVFEITVPGSAGRYYLLRREGLTPITATSAALVLGDPQTREKVYEGSAAAASLGADALRGHQAPQPQGSGEAGAAGALPENPPKAATVEQGQTPCARIEAGGSGTRVSVALVGRSDLGPAAQPPPDGFTPACVPVGRIVVRPGGGALVHALGAGGGDVGGTVYLVTDTGMKYRVASAKAMEALGYTTSQVQRLPAPLLAMLPTGPDLSPGAASSGNGSTTTTGCEPLKAAKPVRNVSDGLAKTSAGRP
ncbi:type VII secretion protein EccB [Streptomyces zagrosensis]|uniref:Type VII secretion protein EccB n=1 Tax=Streptomyces zagrosensis TaxID=1042984 RepID=A0A7W9V1Y8_9ACTN|nr:type VII secretion protein EccB [Streptomyces zagrosensis]MBB5939705.1 type VII secretion protein EccB [Streptomyces zagrosensis]